MSFIGASGSAGGSGRLVPTNPFSPTLAVKPGINNGETPVYTVSFTASSVNSGKVPITGYTATFYYVVGVTEFVRGSCPITNGGDTTGSFLTTGPHYVRINAQSPAGLSAQSSNSATVTALTKPADMGTITGSLSGGNISFTWNNVNAGGHNEVTYSVLLQQSTDGGVTWPFTPAGGASNTTSTTYGFNTSSFTSGLFRANITPTTPGGSGASAISNSVTYTVAPPPPPPPPYFPPYFAPPYFGPSFGPYFCLQADSPVLVWVDGKTLQKKVKDIEVGDKVVSYTFAELPENDSEYSLNSWNSQSMTPLEAKEATVVRNEKLIAQSTVFFNGDINNRMSLEHLVFIERDGKYSIVLAGLVEPGDTVLKINEETLEIYESVIESVDHLNEQTEIYKLDVTPYDVFFGGNILTHNKGGFY